MVVLKIVGKILLVPVWIIVAFIWMAVKMIVAIYSFARVFIIVAIGILIIGTAICYQDWKQVVFLFCISGSTFILLFAGIAFESCLETVRSRIGHAIMY